MADPKGPLAARLRVLVCWLEAFGVAAGLGTFRLLPLDLASATGGWLCRRFGPLVPVSRHAERNLRLAFPEKTDAEIRRILVAMWEHLGRVFGEYAVNGQILGRQGLYFWDKGKLDLAAATVDQALRLNFRTKSRSFFRSVHARSTSP